MSAAPLAGTARVRDLVPGDPDRVASLASQFATIGGGLLAAAEALSRLGVARWNGSAAQAFQAALGMPPGPLRAGGAAFAEAAARVSAHAEVLLEAQAVAEVVIALAARAEADPTPATGAATRAAAERALASAQLEVAESSRRVAASLHDLGRRAPTEPNVFARTLVRAEHLHAEVALGVGEALYDLAALIVSVNPQRALSNPQGWLTDTSALVEGAQVAVTHPQELAKALVDWDTWSKNPARAVGHLLPDVAMAVGTGGASAGAKGGEALAAVRRLAGSGRLLGKAASGSDAFALPIHSFAEWDRLRAYVQKVNPLPDVYDVAMHGDPRAVAIELRDGRSLVAGHRTLARFIASRADYFGEVVRLLSCQTGGLPDGLAQNLANKLGVDVLAPSDRLWIFGNGDMTIGQDALDDTGHWIRFRPGGNR